MTRPDQTRPDQTRPDQTTHVRNSSLELLRIIAMLMIVANHFVVYSGFNFANNSAAINRLWGQFISLGNLGNDIFIMLSGYFLIKSTRINLYRLFDLWLRICLYSITVYMLCVFTGLQTFSSKTMLDVIRPITANKWWFASTYFVLYLVHPYINSFLLSLSKEDYKKFLLTLGIYWSIIPTLMLSSFGANQTIVFMYLYSIAGYVRLHVKNHDSTKYILYGIACVALNCVYLGIRLVIAIKFPILGTGRGGDILFPMVRPFIILAAMCFLAGFRNLDISNNRIINTIASAVFGVYLIHENSFSSTFLWRKVFHSTVFQGSPYFIPYSIAVTLTVYISCTVIELLRSKVFKAVSGGRLS